MSEVLNSVRPRPHADAPRVNGPATAYPRATARSRWRARAARLACLLLYLLRMKQSKKTLPTLSLTTEAIRVLSPDELLTASGGGANSIGACQTQSTFKTYNTFITH